MTCVVSIAKKGGGVLLAADSQSSSDYLKRFDTDSKVFQLSPVLAIAYCGSGRLGQIIKHWVMDAMEEPPLDRDLRRWYVREFQPILRDVLDQHGHLATLEEDKTEHLGNSAFLLAVRDRAFAIESDFSINESERPFEAMGSGGATAVGAMHAEADKAGHPRTEPLDKGWGVIEDMAARAIEAAAETTPYVGGPIRFVRTEIYTPEEKALAKLVLKNAPTTRDDEGWYL